MASFPLRALASVAALATLAGCSVIDGVIGDEESETETSDGSEAEVREAPGVIVADPNATLVAEVSADRVVFPAAQGERYRAMQTGTVFVGARAGATSKNPDGFLRRVTSVVVEGDRVVVSTSPAAITDAIAVGSMKTSTGGGKVDDHLTSANFKGIDVDFADKPLFDNVDDIEVDGKKASFKETIRLERAVLSARPSVDVDLRIQDGKVSRFTAKVEGNLDSSIRAVANVTPTGDVDDAILEVLKTKKHEVDRQLFQSKRMPLPTFSVGRVPVSPSVQFTVSLRCTFTFGGAIHAYAGVEAKSYLRLGGVYENGAWGSPIASEFDIQPTFEVTRGAEGKARCAIVADAELFVYGTSAITMSVAPYLDFDVAAGVRDIGPPPYIYEVHAGAMGAMSGRDSILGIGAADLNRELVDWKAKQPITGRME